MTPFTLKCEEKSRTKLEREKIEKKPKKIGGFLLVKMAVKIFNWQFEQVRIVRKKFH
jgi:hypothetical protein